MELTIKLLTVLSIGAVELWAAIPAGLALRLHPVAIGIVAAIGAILGALVVLVLGQRARTWLTRKFARQGERGRQGRINRVWHRYGVKGLGLLAPLVTGAPLGVVLGLALGARAGQLLLWTSLGIVLWSAILTTAAALGLAGIQALWR